MQVSCLELCTTWSVPCLLLWYPIVPLSPGSLCFHQLISFLVWVDLGLTSVLAFLFPLPGILCPRVHLANSMSSFGHQSNVTSSESLSLVICLAAHMNLYSYFLYSSYHYLKLVFSCIFWVSLYSNVNSISEGTVYDPLLCPSSYNILRNRRCHFGWPCQVWSTVGHQSGDSP